MAKKKTDKKNNADLLRTARKQAEKAIEADKENRDAHIEDLKFLEGDQWTTDAKATREDRPCLTINKLPQFLDLVEGDQRQNRPAIKVVPVDDRADVETAKIMSGLIRNIEADSDADIAYDTAFQQEAAGGYGVFRIITEYAAEDVFEQDIKVKRVENPMMVVFDPDAKEWDRSDGKFAFVFEDVPRDDWDDRFPGKTPMEFDTAKGELEGWATSETVRIAEYFKKVPGGKKTIYQLEDGTITDTLKEGQEAVRQREVETQRVDWYLISGNEVLKGPKKWPGKYIPLVPVWGKELNINGKRIRRGLIRHAKDPQRMYNYSRSAGIELVALTPKSPYMVTPKQIEGHENQWKQAHKKNYPYMLYNHDPNAPNKPYKEQPVQLSTAITTEIALSNEELRDTTGIQDASLGKMSNERSGRAIAERRRSGDISTFVFPDNLARSIRYGGRILVDLIPKIYDTARIIRVRGEDGSIRTEPVNQPVVLEQETGEQRLYDLTVGKYDVVVTVGPSYATKRIETADSMIAFVQAVPEAAKAVMDLIAKNMDWPGADDIAERLKKLLPPGLAEPEDGDQGLTLPGNLPPPNPVDALKVQQEQEKLAGIQLENQIKAAELAGKQMETKEQIMEMINEILQGNEIALPGQVV